MSKILLFSDAHIHTHKNSIKRLQHCLQALEWALQTAVERDIQHILFLGDLFQDREKIQTLPYQRTYEIINKYAGGISPKLYIYFLIGNHDMWFADNTDISSVYPFGSITNVKVIGQPSTINVAGLDVDFLPFTLNPLKALSHFTNKSRVLCGHIALDGAKMNAYHIGDISVEYDGDMIKVDSNIFTSWEKVFLGHYHGEQKVKHIEYIGSPLQLNFAEAFEEKHVIILDTDTLAQEYVVNTFSPRHLIIDESDLSKYDLNNTFIRFNSNNMTSTDFIDIKNTLLKEYDILSFEQATPAIKNNDQEVKNHIQQAKHVFSSNQTEILDQYVEATGTANLERKRLIELGKTLCQRSQIN